jgi:hypothetical protein
MPYQGLRQCKFHRKFCGRFSLTAVVLRSSFVKLLVMLNRSRVTLPFTRKRRTLKVGSSLQERAYTALYRLLITLTIHAETHFCVSGCTIILEAREKGAKVRPMDLNAPHRSLPCAVYVHVQPVSFLEQRLRRSNPSGSRRFSFQPTILRQQHPSLSFRFYVERDYHILPCSRFNSRLLAKFTAQFAELALSVPSKTKCYTLLGSDNSL